MVTVKRIRNRDSVVKVVIVGSIGLPQGSVELKLLANLAPISKCYSSGIFEEKGPGLRPNYFKFLSSQSILIVPWKSPLFAVNRNSSGSNLRISIPISSILSAILIPN